MALSPGIPIFNLVRTDTMGDQYFIDVESGATEYDRHDEIRLIDPQGSPVGIPNQRDRDNDVLYKYGNGSRDRLPRLHEHEISLAIDYITDDLRRRLLSWKKDRATMWINPGFGALTEFAWRAIEGVDNLGPSVTQITDLTQRHDLDAVGNENGLMWDDWWAGMGLMRKFTAVNVRFVMRSKIGAVQRMVGARRNRFIPSYPESATEGAGTGNSGWDKAGTDSAQITFAHVSGGFGHDDCPDSLRVSTTDAVSSSRRIEQIEAWDPAPAAGYQGYDYSGTGTIKATIKVKGRFGGEATLIFGAYSGGSIQPAPASVTLTDRTIEGWTAISIEHSADWDTYYPGILINLVSSAGDPSDFEIGPQVMWEGIDHGETMATWLDDGAAQNVERVSSTSAVQLPTAGNVIGSFYLPPRFDTDLDNLVNWNMPIVWHNSGGFVFFRSSGSGGATALRFYRTSTDFDTANVTLSSGVHTVGYVYGPKHKALYFDGEQVALNEAAANQEFDLTDSAALIYIGSDLTDGCWPCMPATVRWDARVLTADEMANECAALMDPGTLEVAVPARGREYEILEVPSTPRVSCTETQYVGNLVLRQVNYDRDTQDITTKE